MSIYYFYPCGNFNSSHVALAWSSFGIWRHLEDTVENALRICFDNAWRVVLCSVLNRPLGKLQLCNNNHTSVFSKLEERGAFKIINNVKPSSCWEGSSEANIQSKLLMLKLYILNLGFLYFIQVIMALILTSPKNVHVITAHGEKYQTCVFPKRGSAFVRSQHHYYYYYYYWTNLQWKEIFTWGQRHQ